VSLLRRRADTGDSRPIPDHPYRDTALVYAAMAVVLVIVATATGGDPLRATGAALIFFTLATGWSWWRFRTRIKARDAAAAAASSGAPTPGSGRVNGNGRGGNG
jgi:Flp pilus assembly protein TadB